MAKRSSRRTFRPFRQRRRARLKRLGMADALRLRLEPLEERMLLAFAPELVGVDPNTCELLRNGDIRNVAPTDLTFRFDENQVIDPATVDAIRITRAGQDGVFGNGNDVVVTPGFLGIGDAPNEVVMRFAETL